MMSNSYRIGAYAFFLLCAAFQPMSAYSQITLDEYRRSVYEASSEIQNAAEQVGQSYWSMRREKTSYLPSLSAAGSLSTSLRRTVAEDKFWGFALQPTISQTIYGGGLAKASFRRAMTSYESSQQDERSVRLYVRYAADYAYWNLSAQELYKAAVAEYVTIIKSLYRVVEERFKEGYVAKGDMLQVEARLSDAEYSQIALQNQYDMALHSFNNLRSADQLTSAILMESIIDSIPMPHRVGREELAARRPDIAVATMAVQMAKYSTDITRAAYLPKISANIGGSWHTFSPNTSNRTFVDGAATISLSVPLFHWGERRYAVAAAQTRERIAENDLDSAHDDMLQQEADGWSALQNSYAQMQSSLKNLQIAGENLSISTYSYREGRATVLDVLQAQISWIQIYTNAITARFNYAVAVSAYKRITAED